MTPAKILINFFKNHHFLSVNFLISGTKIDYAVILIIPVFIRNVKGFAKKFRLFCIQIMN